MKKTLALFVTLLALGTAQAQTFNEWFRQKKTKIRYLVEQIAALKAYGGVVEKGYSVAKTGLNTISSIKRGDLQLHEDRFTSLRVVSPAVRNYWKLQACQKLDAEIIDAIQDARQMIAQALLLKPKEKLYAGGVLDRMLGHSAQLVNGLLQIAMDGRTNLTDAERIARIDGFYALFTDLKSTAREFGNTLRTLALQRERELKDVQAARRMHHK